MEEFEALLNGIAERLMKQHNILMDEAVKRINALFASGMITQNTILIDSFLAIPSEVHEKTTHGGKRKGSGRPKKEKTKVMRIPVSKVEAVKELIRNEK